MSLLAQATTLKSELLEAQTIRQTLTSLEGKFSHDLPDVDAVVGIARGGLLPTSLVAYQFQHPLHLMRLNFRDDQNKPRTHAPHLLKQLDFVLFPEIAAGVHCPWSLE